MVAGPRAIVVTGPHAMEAVNIQSVMLIAMIVVTTVVTIFTSPVCGGLVVTAVVTAAATF